MAHDPHEGSQTHIPEPGEPLVDLYPPGAAWAESHHGHVIVPHRMLLTVLGILMFFTLATVGAARAEIFIAHTLHIEIPQWVNVFIALSIATVKSIVVAAFFMQLRYDNPLNTLVVIFTIMTVGFFIGFTAIDLGGRDTVYDYKGHEIVSGGTGGQFLERHGRQITTSMAVDARQEADKQIISMLTENPKAHLPPVLEHRVPGLIADMRAKTPPVEPPKVVLDYHEAMLHSGHGDHFAHASNTHSSPDRSRPRTGITLDFLKPPVPAGGEHKEAPKPAPGH